MSVQAQEPSDERPTLGALDSIEAVEAWWARLCPPGAAIIVPGGELSSATKGRSYAGMMYSRRLGRRRNNLLEVRLHVDGPPRLVRGGREFPLDDDDVIRLGILGMRHLSDNLRACPTGARRVFHRRSRETSRRQVLLWWRQWLLWALRTNSPLVEELEPEPWLRIGSLLSSGGHYDLAEECLVRHLSLCRHEHQLARAQLTYIAMLVTAGRNAKALDTIQQAQPTLVNYPEAVTEMLLWKGRALRDLGRLGEAEEIGLFNLRRSAAILNSRVARQSIRFLVKVYARRFNVVGMVRVLWGLVRTREMRRLMFRYVGRRVHRAGAARGGDIAISTPPPLKQIASVAVCRLDGLGDLVMGIPAMQLLRTRLGGARIDLYLAAPWGAVAGWLGLFDNIYELQVEYRNPNATIQAAIPQGMRYDLSVDMIYHPRTYQDQLLNSIQAAHSLGFDTPSHRRRCDLRVSMPPMRTHSCDLAMALMTGLGIAPDSPALPIPRMPRDRFASADALSPQLRAALADGNVVGVHPGAGWPLRRWYPERFASVADELIRRTGCRILLLGAADDRVMIDQIRQGMLQAPMTLICDNLEQLAQSLAGLTMFLCHDSGPMHLAGALGVPMVVVWSCGDLIQYAPRGSRTTIIRHQPLCAPCCQEGKPDRCGMGYRWREIPCLTPITAQEVLRASREMLEAISVQRSPA